MIPVRAWARNYGPFGSVEWLIREGVTVIVGRNDAGEGISSNGAGKSKLLEIPYLSLFGPRLGWGDYLRLGGGADELEVGLEFVQAGRRYRAVRTFSAKSRGKSTTDLLVEGDVADSWSALTRSTQAETQQEIERILGVTESTFSHAVYAAQEYPHFASAHLTAAQRKEVLGDALGLGRWDGRRERARTDVRRVEVEHAELIARLTDWQAELETLETVDADVASAEARVADLDASIVGAVERQDGLRSRYDEARSARTRLTETIAAVESARRALMVLEGQSAKAAKDVEEAAGIEMSLGELEKAAVGVEALRAELADATAKRQSFDALSRAHSDRVTSHQRELEQARAAVTAAEAERDAANAETDEIERKKAALLATASPTCEACGQPLDDAGREKAVAALTVKKTTSMERSSSAQARAAEARARVASLEEVELGSAPTMVEIPAGLEDRVRAAEAAVAEVAARRAKAQALRDGAAAALTDAFAESLRAAQDEHAAKTKAAEAITALDEAQVSELARQALEAVVAVEALRREEAAANAALGSARTRRDARDSVAKRIDGKAAETAVLARRLSVLSFLQRAYSRDGIPALLMETLAIPQIERGAQEVLDKLGAPFRVELRTQRELKGSDRLRDTLDVIVHEPNGERRYETYSGGERARLNVALMIGLARLLWHRSGTPIGMFALDEVEFLDKAGVEALARLLRDLQSEVPCIPFVSHVPELVDDVDHVVTVVKEAGSSRIEVSA